ncbi:histidine kinase [Floricoccus tropicus]|uniref:histidine kinase n=1 Tax=Floricoccus tropicus TaxID=1859473 RepID=A0A1E8GP83_9LACT|nr:sensor histidine kinase [Floricoccus tropicus]OFI50061.1 histidine kinase [Floricoccus tropicus]
MFELFILMMERVGLIILLAFLLVNVPYFKKILLSREKLSSKLQLILILGSFAIISNFTGVEISKNQIIPSNILTSINIGTSIANTRTLVIGVSGLVGGPFVGGAVGLIAGIHRVLQSGGTSAFYIPSSLIIGVLSGIASKLLSRKHPFPPPVYSVIVVVLMELIQFAFILTFSSNFEESKKLISLIALPMIILNSLGTFIFMSILTITLRQEEQAKAVQTHDVLSLAAETLPFFRKGLNEESCQQAAAIIKHYTRVSAISMTNENNILAHVGAASDHHIPKLEILTELSKNVITSGEMVIAHSKEEVGCPNPNCPLQAAIVIPLVVKDKTVGTLKMYFTDPSKLTHVEEQLAEGLATIFSSQIELGESEAQAKLLQEAEIKSLQAQVNPHFFFNAINTISALMRKDSDKARKLLLQLSNYFRGNLQGASQTTIPLKQELSQVDSYLSLEQARFPNRYTVNFDIEDDLDDILVPPYSIQILLENAIKHAFGNRKENNIVDIKVKLVNNKLNVLVSDNGNGISPERLPQIGKMKVDSKSGTGTALQNLYKRISNLYSNDGSFSISNIETGGCQIELNFPAYTEEQNARINS